LTGTYSVEKVVPIADPGTNEFLRIAMRDGLDQIAFVLNA
jgi:hypothetical protein